jgi:hypothetical protein
MFLSSTEDLENISDLNDVDFISINRVIGKNSGNWIEKMPNDEQKKLYSQRNNSSWDYEGYELYTGTYRPKKFDSEEKRATKLIKIHKFFAKSNGLEQDRKNEEKTLVQIYKKLLNFIDNGLKLKRIVNHIIDNFERNLNYNLESLSEENFNYFKIEIEKRKNLAAGI